jgi:predicted metalloprotease with PDZ domain/lysophospholipase L1-like esterase
MRIRLSLRLFPCAFLWLTALASAAQAQLPITYTVKFPEPARNYALVEAAVPTGEQASVELMMPVWTPGFYRVEDYAGKVQTLEARAPDGAALKAERVKPNRWRIQTGGAATAVVSYKLPCTRRSVTGNWVGADVLLLNGGSSFLTLVEKGKRPHEVLLELPPEWKRSMTGLEAAPGGKPHHYRAADYDTLVDSPILAGNLAVTEFDVDGSKHVVAAGGDTAQWDGERAAADLRKIVEANRRLWGPLPFARYAFLFVVREKGGGGGGLEHANSALMFSGATAPRGKGNFSWLMFVSHEYCHAFNVKRLRPVELGPFDYEKPPRTTGLWVAEGLTTYYGDLLVRRAGLCDTDAYLARLSGQIGRLQKTPGRLVQTLEQASADVWTASMSGIGGAGTLSYYVKGPVVGFLLDAKIRRATNGARSLDDLMRLAYRRYGGEKGFTAEQFRQAAEEVAGCDLKEPFRKWLATTEELDYAGALEWFGLRFAPGEGANQTWRLEVRADATAVQQGRLRAWLEPTGRLPTLFLIGDSTVNNGTKGQQGWGTPLAGLFDPATIKVENRARGGRSSRTYLTEGLWDQVLARLQPGDFVLVQFGHNDGGSLTDKRGRASLKGAGEETREVIAATGTKEIVHTYGWYLRKYAAATRARGATLVVLSPVPRNIWKGEGVARAATDYGKWAAQAAKAEGALFLDLNEFVARRYEALGRTKVDALFGGDHTHTNAAGARLTAAALAEGLRGLEGCSLSRYLLPATKE